MTLTDLRARLTAVRTMHDATCPRLGTPEFALWQSERELLKAVDEALKARLYAQQHPEVRS